MGESLEIEREVDLETVCGCSGDEIKSIETHWSVDWLNIFGPQWLVRLRLRPTNDLEQIQILEWLEKPLFDGQEENWDHFQWTIHGEWEEGHSTFDRTVSETEGKWHSETTCAEYKVEHSEEPENKERTISNTESDSKIDYIQWIEREILQIRRLRDLRGEESTVRKDFGNEFRFAEGGEWIETEGRVAMNQERVQRQWKCE